MPSYTINTNARDESALAKTLAKVNADRALNSLAPMTLSELAQRVFADNLAGYAKQADDEEVSAIAAAYLAASNGTKTAVKAQLGVS